VSRERRSARLAQLYAELAAHHADRAPEPPEDLEDSWSHHVDAGVPPGVEAEFQRAAEETFPRESNRRDATELGTDARMDMDSLRGSAAMADLRAAFAEAGLPKPRIPDGLVSALMKQRDWCWATRPVDPLDMCMFDRYPDEVFRSSIESERLEDYVAVSHAGHGASSYFLTYQLVLGCVAIFVQIGWGDAALDEEVCRLRVERAFRGIATLLEAAKPLLSMSAGSGSRLVVLASERPVGVVGWLGPSPVSSVAVDIWRNQHAWPPHNVLARAVDLALTGL